MMHDGHRVFIAYSREDGDVVSRLAQILRENGLDPMWDRDLPVGAGFTEKIGTFIAHAHVFVPLITAHSQENHWVHQEIGFASALKVPVLPVCIGVDPRGLIQGLQGIYLPADLAGAAARLSRQVFDGLVREAARNDVALYEVAADNHARARLLADYAFGVSRLDRHGIVRQGSVLSSFHIPDVPYAHELWARRYGGQRRERAFCEDLRQERQALQEHVARAGCRLILDFSIDFRGYGPDAFPARLEVLRKFLAEPSHPDVAVAVTGAGEGDRRASGGTTTMVGDWFLVESLSGSVSSGYMQTVFTRHAPTVRRRLHRFDEEFDLLVQDQPGGVAASGAFALWTIDALLEACRHPPRAWSLAFPYAPESPTEHGWRLGEAQRGELTFARLEGAPLGPGLAVRARRGYALDYTMDGFAFEPRRVKFLFRSIRDASLYVRLRLKHAERGDQVGWLRVRGDASQPQFVGDADVGWFEWDSPVSTREIGSGWQEADLDLGTASDCSFGQLGFELERLDGLRVRGDVDLSQVRVY